MSRLAVSQMEKCQSAQHNPNCLRLRMLSHALSSSGGPRFTYIRLREEFVYLAAILDCGRVLSPGDRLGAGPDHGRRRRSQL